MNEAEGEKEGDIKKPRLQEMEIGGKVQGTLMDARASSPRKGQRAGPGEGV